MEDFKKIFYDKKEGLTNINKLYEILERELGSKVGEYRKKWKDIEKTGVASKYPLHLNFELNFMLLFKQ